MVITTATITGGAIIMAGTAITGGPTGIPTTPTSGITTIDITATGERAISPLDQDGKPAVWVSILKRCSIHDPSGPADTWPFLFGRGPSNPETKSNEG